MDLARRQLRVEMRHERIFQDSNSRVCVWLSREYASEAVGVEGKKGTEATGAGGAGDDLVLNDRNACVHRRTVSDGGVGLLAALAWGWKCWGVRRTPYKVPLQINAANKKEQQQLRSHQALAGMIECRMTHKN